MKQISDPAENQSLLEETARFTRISPIDVHETLNLIN